jgi:hypothetical protein
MEAQLQAVAAACNALHDAAYELNLADNKKWQQGLLPRTPLASGENSITVMTYNVMRQDEAEKMPGAFPPRKGDVSVWDSGELKPELRLLERWKWITHTIHKARADVICFQAIEGTDQSSNSTSLGMLRHLAGYKGVIFSDEKGTVPSNIATYFRGPLPVGGPDDYDQYRGKNVRASIPKTPLRLRGGIDLCVVNVSIANADDDELAALLELIDKKHVILMGSFGAVDTSLLIAAGFRGTHIGKLTYYNGKTMEASDDIWYRGLDSPTDMSKVPTITGPIPNAEHASNHLPLWATFEF